MPLLIQTHDQDSFPQRYPKGKKAQNAMTQTSWLNLTYEKKIYSDIKISILILKKWIL